MPYTACATLHTYIHIKLYVCICDIQNDLREVNTFIILLVASESFTQFIKPCPSVWPSGRLMTIYSCTQLIGRNFQDVSNKFGKLKCFDDRMKGDSISDPAYDHFPYNALFGETNSMKTFFAYFSIKRNEK